VFVESNIDLAVLDGFAFASRKMPEYMHPRLVECSECGILYGTPVLSPETLAGAYEAAQFDSEDEGNRASRTYAHEIRKILPRLPDLNGSLDIGAGNGAFIEELLALGFKNVAGVEPSTAPFSCAKSEIRPLIRHAMFRPADYVAGSFSLVTCFQTMEHVWDPAGTVLGAFYLLKPGGAFVMVVHNRRSWTARLLGLKSPIFDIEHLQLFCPRSATGLLDRIGFRGTTASSLWNRYPIHYWAKLAPFPPAIKPSVFGFLKHSAIGRIPLAVPVGNLFCFGFKGNETAASTGR
jgi:SAM-dependent methyltransferase